MIDMDVIAPQEFLILKLRAATQYFYLYSSSLQESLKASDNCWLSFDTANEVEGLFLNVNQQRTLRHLEMF